MLLLRMVRLNICVEKEKEPRALIEEFIPQSGSFSGCSEVNQNHIRSLDKEVEYLIVRILLWCELWPYGHIKYGNIVRTTLPQWIVMISR